MSATEERIIASISPDAAAVEPNLCAVVDGDVLGFKNYWPLPRGDDYRADMDRLRPGWRSFSIYQGRVVDGFFVGRPLCGMVRRDI